MALEITYAEYNFTLGQGYISELVTATGGYEPYSWEIINGTVLPDGMLFNESTGYITGVAEAIQSLTVDFRVTDSNPGGAETATASLPFVVVDAPNISPGESFLEFHLGVLTTYTSTIAGGVEPFSLELVEWNGPAPVTDDSAIVGRDIVWSYTLDTEYPAASAYYRITDANGMIAETLINLLGIDASVGTGGNGIPHVNFRDGSSESAEMESPGTMNLTGVRGLYGGVPPYTVEILNTLPAGEDITYEISTEIPYNGWITGTFSEQGVYPIEYRITDSEGNYADFSITASIFKKVHISPILPNIGTINEPYQYQIKDNYVEGDVFYPTTYDIDLEGQGLLPTGYSVYHDEETHENFIIGTTEFSNAFPITLGAFNAAYSGGAYRSTWNTTIFVGGIVSVTHEVL